MLNFRNYSKLIGISLIVLVTLFSFNFIKTKYEAGKYGAPPYIEENETSPENFAGRYGDLSNWVRPEGPLRVGLQAGHYLNEELPDELSKLRGSSLGTSRGMVTEWEVNLKIAENTKKLLEEKGIVVDILPATIPKGYYADAFVSIHADGSIDSSMSGFKVAAPRRRITEKSQELSSIIEDVYKDQTDFELDENISRNMTGYYAFNWRRYEHSVHPMTPSVILETGFMTNHSDAKVLINNPEIPAKALADALAKFLIV